MAIEDTMSLTESDILHINAAVIMGLLILLTVSGDSLTGFDSYIASTGATESEASAARAMLQFYSAIVILAMIIPFLLSAMVMMIMKIIEVRKKDTKEAQNFLFKLALFCTLGGFMGTALGLSFFVLFRYGTMTLIS